MTSPAGGAAPLSYRSAASPTHAPVLCGRTSQPPMARFLGEPPLGPPCLPAHTGTRCGPRCDQAALSRTGRARVAAVPASLPLVARPWHSQHPRAARIAHPPPPPPNTRDARVCEPTRHAVVFLLGGVAAASAANVLARGKSSHAATGRPSALADAHGVSSSCDVINVIADVVRSQPAGRVGGSASSGRVTAAGAAAARASRACVYCASARTPAS